MNASLVLLQTSSSSFGQHYIFFDFGGSLYRYIVTYSIQVNFNVFYFFYF